MSVYMCVCVCGEILVQPAAVPGSLIGQIRSGPTHIRKSILVGDLLKADKKKFVAECGSHIDMYMCVVLKCNRCWRAVCLQTGWGPLVKPPLSNKNWKRNPNKSVPNSNQSQIHTTHIQLKKEERERERENVPRPLPYALDKSVRK